MPDDVVFLVDVDNTLLDNGTVVDDLKRRLVDVAGVEGQRRYWEIFEQVWAERGFADYFGALQLLRTESLSDQRLFGVASFLLNYPFVDRLYPGALDAIAGLQTHGRVVIVADGDTVYQPNKIDRSGLGAAVGGHVLIYVHKEEMLEDIERRYPARHYVIIEDKLRILAAVKDTWGTRVTTVFVRQGHYALDPAIVAAYSPADVTIERIGDLMTLDLGLSAES